MRAHQRNTERPTVQLMAKGSHLMLPPGASAERFFAVNPQLTVQFSTSTSTCWEAGYSAANATKNDADGFKAGTP